MIISGQKTTTRRQFVSRSALLTGGISLGLNSAAGNLAAETETAFSAYQLRRRADLWGLLGDLPWQHESAPPKLVRTEEHDRYTLERLVLDLNGIERGAEDWLNEERDKRKQSKLAKFHGNSLLGAMRPITPNFLGHNMVSVIRQRKLSSQEKNNLGLKFGGRNAVLQAQEFENLVLNGTNDSSPIGITAFVSRAQWRFRHSLGCLQALRELSIGAFELPAEQALANDHCPPIRAHNRQIDTKLKLGN